MKSDADLQCEGGTEAVNPDSGDGPTTERERQPANMRGLGFGCLYAFLSWLIVGVLATLLIPGIFWGPDWDVEEIAARVSQVTFLVISVPLGIYGFLRHRRPQPVACTDRCFDAELRVLGMQGGAEGSSVFLSGRRATLRYGGTEDEVRIVLLGRSQLAWGETGRARIELSTPDKHKGKLSEGLAFDLLDGSQRRVGQGRVTKSV